MKRRTSMPFKVNCLSFVWAVCGLALLLGWTRTGNAQENPGEIVQAHAVLTVAEGKRLIASAVAKMPIVQKALKDGMVIICKGTTNTYVAEEILGRRIEHGALVSGRITPEKAEVNLPAAQPMPEVILIKGKLQKDMSLLDAVKQLKPGDVVIKGGNLLDYQNKVVGVCIGSPTGGTTGTIMPYITARKAHLVIPIGLEKQVSGNGQEIISTLREPIRSLTEMPSMYPLTGHIVTEIEAMKILADVEAFQATAGGIGGAEGAAWLVWRGPEEKVRKALEVARSVQGEKPFADEPR